MHETFLSNLIITEICSVFAMYNNIQAKGRKRNRTRWAMILKYEGQTLYTTGVQTLHSDSGHLMLLPKGCSYEWVCTQAGHYFAVEFECNASYPTAVSIPVKQGQRLLRRLQELEQTWNLQGAMCQQACLRNLYDILLTLAQPAPTPYIPGDKQQRLLPVLEYLSQNYNQPVTNDQLAQITGMSTVYFRRLFTQVMGVSPIAYARQVRIEKAKQMLRSDYGTLSHLALSLGYANLYDFSRDFKKHTGLAPSQY